MKIYFDSEKLLSEYSNMIYRIASGYFDNKDDIEDIAQEVYIRYMNYVEENGKFNDSIYERNWIIRVTINLCTNEVKSARKKYNVPLKDEPFYCYDIDTKTDLEVAISKLKEKYRTVFEMFYFEDLKISEISKVLKITEASVKTRLKRAKAKLEKILKSGGEYSAKS